MAINPFYLQPQIIAQIKKKLGQENIVILHNVLDEAERHYLNKSVPQYRFAKLYLPHKHRYYSADKNIPAVSLSRLLEHITNKRLSLVAQRFEKGSYTLLHDQLKPHTVEALYFLNDFDPAFGGSFFQVDGKGNYAKVIPMANMLVVMFQAHKHKTDNRHYIKYINHTAAEKKLYLLSWFSFSFHQ